MDTVKVLQLGNRDFSTIMHVSACAKWCYEPDFSKLPKKDLLVVTDQKISDRALAADIRWSLDEPVNGVKTDIVYKNEASEEMQNVFENIVKHEKKMILEVIG